MNILVDNKKTTVYTKMSIRICACPTCFNTSRTNTNLLWFPLPKPGFLRDQWMDILGIKDSTINESSRVCSFHFKAKDISKSKVLKADAVPSIHLGKKGEANFINDEDIELSDDEIKVVEEKKKEEPSPPTNTPEGRPSRRAARMAAEKIQNTVRKYGLNDESPPPSPKKVELNYNPVFEKGAVMVKQPFDTYNQKKVQPIIAPRSQMQVINLPLNKIQTTSSGQQISLKVAIPQPQQRTIPITTKNQITYSVKPSTTIAKPTLSNPTTTVILKPITGASKTAPPTQLQLANLIAASKPSISAVKPQPVTSKSQIMTLKPQTGITPKPQIGVTPKTPRQSSNVTKLKDETMNLVMECVEISLSPAQLKAQHSAVKAYEEFERKMKAYKTAKDTRIIYCTTNEVPPVNASHYTSSLISNTSPAMPQGSNTGKVPEKPAGVAKAVRAPVLQPGMVITQTPQGVQLIRGVVPQQNLVLGNTTNTVTQGANSQMSYKVLVDSRTGLVVGTIPNDSPLLQNATANNSQPTLTIQPSKPLQTASSTNSSGLTISGVQGNVTTLDNAYNKIISGGNKTVVAQSLLSIKVVPDQNMNKDARNAQITQLSQILDKDKFLSAPILWLSKVGLVDKEIKCLCMKDRMELSACKFSVDGYLWRCKRAPRCQRTVQIPRISFFARFGAQLYKLHRLIFHWSVQSDILHVIHDTVVDIYMVRSVWRAIQEICGKALDNKSVKLGGPGNKVEIATIKMGWHVIIGAYDRVTGLSRMKVVTENKGQPFGITSIILKNVEQWLMPHSTVITTDYKLSTINRNQISYKYINLNAPYNADLTVRNAVECMETQLVRMFGSFSMVQLKPETIQGFLDEYQWRVRYGKTPRTTFWNIISDIANQSGRKLIIPKEVNLAVTASSSSSEDDVILDESGKVQVQNLLKHAGSWSHQPKIVKPTPPPKPPPPPEPPKLVDLNNYYYARKNPDAALSQVDPNLNTYHFKCLVCRKVLDNNIKVMKHLMAHLEQTRQRNPDLSDLTQCKYCFRDFETPYSMQCHMENVHLSTNNLACKICNHALASKPSLINHMKHHHVQSEIPYCCSTCNFRSSFHREVIDHFQQNHNGTNKLLCHYCLKTYNIKFHTANTVGVIQNYYYHLYKHQIKSANKKCSNCCLVFVNVIELKTHRQKDHLSMAKKKDVMPLPINTQHPILVPEPTKKPKGAKSPPNTGPRRSKAPIPGPPVLEPYTAQPPPKNYESEELGPVFLPDNDKGLHNCVECKQPIERTHFLKRMSCGKCRYTSNCGKAFVDHMIAQHSNIIKAKKDMHFLAEPVELANPLHCICGFKSVHCNIIAGHLLKCGYKTCYPSAVAALAATVKREPDDNPCDKGSAFFPPLVVLDENEEEFVNNTLSKIPEPAETKQSSLGKRKRIEMEGGCDAEKPNIMNALGLVRRKSTHSDDETDPPLLTREDLDEKPRKGPARNTRSSRTAKRARTVEKEVNEDLDLSREMDLDAPPSLETVDN